MALAISATLSVSSVAYSAEGSLWRYGISTFSGKSPEEKAAVGPSFTMPAPGPASEEITQLPKQKLSLPLNFNFAGYPSAPAIIGSGFSGYDSAIESLPGLPTDLPLPIPDSPIPKLPVSNVPVSADVQFPTDPLDLVSPIGQAIASDAVVETPPLEEEIASWYQIPWTWVTRGWDNHAELGLDGSSGNSRTLAFQTGLELKRKTDRYTFGLDFDYRKAATASVTTEDNGRLNLDYDRLFEDSKWSAFGKSGIEWDQFKAFDMRLNFNGGLGYHFVRSDAASLSTKFGAGASQEIGAPDDRWKAEAVLGIEGEYQLNRYNKMKAKVDYFPAWENFSDYRVVSDVAWEILLDDKDNLSLKLALTDRYDSTPQGAKPNDVYYSLLLLVKF